MESLIPAAFRVYANQDGLIDSKISLKLAVFLCLGQEPSKVRNEILLTGFGITPRCQADLRSMFTTFPETPVSLGIFERALRDRSHYTSPEEFVRQLFRACDLRCM